MRMRRRSGMRCSWRFPEACREASFTSAAKSGAQLWRTAGGKGGACSSQWMILKLLEAAGTLTTRPPACAQLARNRWLRCASITWTSTLSTGPSPAQWARSSSPAPGRRGRCVRWVRWGQRRHPEVAVPLDILMPTPLFLHWSAGHGGPGAGGLGAKHWRIQLWGEEACRHPELRHHPAGGVPGTAAAAVLPHLFS